MESKVYTSTFRTGPNATKKQQMLFATDTLFALSEGYSHIKDSDGTLFFIQDHYNLIEVESIEELLMDPEETEFDCEEHEECCTCGSTELPSLEALEQIIHNTLNQSEPIRPSQADTIYKLVSAIVMLQGLKQ